MLTVTVRFYVTVGGFVGVLATTWRIAYLLGRFLAEFRAHVSASDAQFKGHDADIRELRARRR